MAKKTKHAGRPEGGGADYDVATVAESVVTPSRCRKCKSERRSAYFGCVRNKFAHQIVHLKRTKCLDCGQHRIDRFVERIVSQ